MGPENAAASRPIARRVRAAIVAAVAIPVVLALAAAAFVGGGVLRRTPTPTLAGGIPQLIDETASSGLSHTYGGDLDFSVGGGVAVLDCNDDGRPDLYLPGGERPAELFRNDTPTAGTLRFARLPDAPSALADVNGAYPIDIDGDGRVDLAVLRNGGNRLLRGLGDCRFQDATEMWGLDPGSRHTEAFSATWEPGAMWPTIALGNYVDPASTDPATWCEPNQLVRPKVGGSGFGQPTGLTPSWCALSMLFSDWDGSGRMDLRVSNDQHYYPADRGEEQLWRIEPAQTPRLYTAAEGWVRVQVQGMGIGSYDLTGDSLPEVFLTSQAANLLQTLTAGPSQPTYRDIGLKRGVNVAHPFTGPDQALPSTAWHPAFEDVNNDGFIDLFVSKGNVSADPTYAARDPSNLLLGQPDGTFVEVADKAGILDFDRGRGAAVADFNLDGRLDLVEAFYGSPVRIWRNAGTVAATAAGGGTNATGGAVATASDTGHWLAVRLRAPAPNVDAIGATVMVRVGDLIERREVTIGGGHGGGQLGWLHFGLGPATSAEIEVKWPDGQTTTWQRVDADGFEILDHGSGSIERWTPPAP